MQTQVAAPTYLDPTERELQVLHFISLGWTTREIAARLGIQFKTVYCHRTKLLGKAGAKNSIGLLRWAIRKGLVSFWANDNMALGHNLSPDERRAMQIVLCSQYLQTKGQAND